MDKKTMQVEILLSNVSTDQAEELRHSLGLENLTYRAQMSIPTSHLVIGTISLGLCFISKSFFEEFFKQAGKDTYEWIKVKLGLINAKKRGELHTNYHIQITNVFIHDGNMGDIEQRHDSILHAVDFVWKQLTPQDFEVLKRIKLEYDLAIHSYTEAKLYDGEYLASIDEKKFPEPFKIVKLPEKV